MCEIRIKYQNKIVIVLYISIYLYNTKNEFALKDLRCKRVAAPVEGALQLRDSNCDRGKRHIPPSDYFKLDSE